MQNITRGGPRFALASLAASVHAAFSCTRGRQALSACTIPQREREKRRMPPVASERAARRMPRACACGTGSASGQGDGCRGPAPAEPAGPRGSATPQRYFSALLLRRQGGAAAGAHAERQVVDVRAAIGTDVGDPAGGVPALPLRRLERGRRSGTIRRHGDGAGRRRDRSCRVRFRRRFPSKRTDLKRWSQRQHHHQPEQPDAQSA
jgi:hypothetical protein